MQPRHGAMMLARAAVRPRALPGLAIATALSLAGLLLQQHVLGQVGALAWTLIAACLLAPVVQLNGMLEPGLGLCAGPLLRIAVVLMGSLVTFTAIAELGGRGLVTALAPLAATLAVTLAIGRLLRLNGASTLLVAMGTSVCGASAILATNSLVAARPGQIAAALGAITIMGCAGMIVLPLLLPWLNLSPQQFGLWSGAALQEVAQVAGAAAQVGDASAGVAAAAKMARVLCLAPILFCVSLCLRTGAAPPISVRGAGVPWFLVGFFAVVAANSAGVLPESLLQAARGALPLMLGASIAAIGLRIDIRSAVAGGRRDFALAALSGAFIAGLSLALIVGLAPASH